MALDRRLGDAYASIPSCLRMGEPEDSIIVPPHLLIQRYGIELLFHKARCILHRHHMTKSFRDPSYSYSRKSCVDAAIKLLKHQDGILEEVQPGGILFRQKWFISSLEHHDLLPASMVICLELSQYSSQDQSSRLGHVEDDPNVLRYEREQLIRAVRNSHHLLGEVQDRLP